MQPSTGTAAATVDVGESGAGQRLDNFLARVLKGVPRSHIYRIVRSGEVRVNGARAQASHKLGFGDRVRLPPVRVAAEVAATAPPRSFPVVYEDEALLAIAKPAGVAVHGGSGVAHGVIEQLRAARGERYLELVHRLDRDTSGVLLLALKRSALVALHAGLRERETDKRYQALVAGVWTGDGVSVTKPLLRYLLANGERRVRIAAPGEGQEARSQFRPLQRYVFPPEVARAAGCDGLTLVEARIHTGRTHQIRVHLHSLGHPVVGDDKYGDETLNAMVARGELVPGLARNPRMFLHAARMAVAHPQTGAPLVLATGWPEADSRWLESLRIHIPQTKA